LVVAIRDFMAVIESLQATHYMKALAPTYVGERVGVRGCRSAHDISSRMKVERPPHPALSPSKGARVILGVR
jgi:hypothetical protein